jgi:hypothetical protein
MTFLEYVCFKLLGPPSYSGNNGESIWPCPKCGHPRYHTRPAVAGLKDRFGCWSCGWWGDEADLLKCLQPLEDYGQRKVQLAALREEYDRGAMAGQAFRGSSVVPAANGNGSPGGPGGAAGGVGPGIHSSPGEVGSSRAQRTNPYDRDPQFDEFGPEADEVTAELLAHLAHLTPAVRWRALAACGRALALCARHGLHPLGLSVRCGFERWVGASNQEHMDECRDPECDWYCCRARRGLPPVPPLVRQAGGGADGSGRPPGASTNGRPAPR